MESWYAQFAYFKNQKLEPKTSKINSELSIRDMKKTSSVKIESKEYEKSELKFIQTTISLLLFLKARSCKKILRSSKVTLVYSIRIGISSISSLMLKEIILNTKSIRHVNQ